MTTTEPRNYATLSSRGLRHDIPPMRLYHKAKKLGIWDPRDIDLKQDLQDWQALSPAKQENLRGLVIAFQAGEEAVTVDLLPLIMTIAREGRLEEEMFLTTFLWEEAKHTEFFRRILDEVFQVNGDLHALRGNRNPNNERDLFSGELVDDMRILLTDPSPANQARASIIYNMIIEGVLAETGYFSFARMLNQANIMPGLREGIAMIKRDESRHIAYGVFLISRLVAQDKSLWPVVEGRMNELYGRIEGGRDQNDVSKEAEETRDFAKKQFQKRLARIERARHQTLEQVYQTADIEETA
ncbi:MAG TPA: R2-like ligand-binding oxidase [Ktedonobacteraceae bacterium]|nr:R2-like ligand-binding oxidase [Ktedonobacteraceae bacterium]